MKNKMKTKWILLACISVVALASCKKEKVELTQPQSSQVSMAEQAADLIKRADKKLYEEVYCSNSQRATSNVTYIPGYFRIPGQDQNGGNVDNGFCMTVDMICMVVVSSGGNATVLPNGNLKANTDLKFSAADNARLIINTDHPVAQSITELKTEPNSSGGINVSFKQ